MVPSFPMRCRHCGESVDSDLLAVGGHTCNPESKRRYIKREKKLERERLLIENAKLKTRITNLQCLIPLVFAIGWLLSYVVFITW